MRKYLFSGLLSLLIISLTSCAANNGEINSSSTQPITSFEEYHSAIFKMELWMKVFSNTVSGSEYQENVSLMDKSRTTNHNSVLGNVNLLNRLANMNNLPPVYDGIVSHDRPYRREVANAVLEYVEKIVKNRR